MTNLVELGVFQYPNGHIAKVVKHYGCESPDEMFGVTNEVGVFYLKAEKLPLIDVLEVLDWLRTCPEKESPVTLRVDSKTKAALGLAADMLFREKMVEESDELLSIIRQIDLANPSPCKVPQPVV